MVRSKQKYRADVPMHGTIELQHNIPQLQVVLFRVDE